MPKELGLFYVGFLTAQLYPVGPLYYYPCQLSNNISLGALKCYGDLKKVKSEPIGNCTFVDSQGRSWRLPYRTIFKLRF